MNKILASIFFMESINILIMMGQYFAIRNDINDIERSIHKHYRKIKKHIWEWLKNGSEG